MLNEVLDIAEAALTASNAAGVAGAFHDRVAGRGVSYLQVRHYRRPPGRLSARAHWKAGGFVARYSRGPWIGSPSSDYVCFTHNPLLEPVARGMTRFRFSDFAPHADRAFGPYWEAMSDGAIGEAIVAVAYGRDEAIASLHVGFDTAIPDPEAADNIHLAASLVAEKLMSFELGAMPARPALTPRERDVLGFIADGKTDWEIAKIIGVSESTARFHADNARTKLGASNRAHAVARFVALYGLF